MLALWMTYALAVSLLMVAGAALAERAIRRRRRILWLAALCAALLAPLARLARPLLPSGGGTPRVLLGPVEPILNAPLGALVGALPTEAASVGVNLALAVAWGMASMAVFLVLAAGAWRLRKARTRWPVRYLDGHRVLLSEGLGPALVGLRLPDIVVPPWVLDLEPGERRLILAHEAQHRSGGDPAILALGLLAVVAQPWNLPLWWGLGRLREGVETDCDARVLAGSRGELRSYAHLLLHVGARPSAPVPLGAGFGERVTTIERRIRAMLGLDSSRGWKAVLVRSALAAVLVVTACSLEVNINTGRSMEEEPGAQATDEADARKLRLRQRAAETQVDVPPPETPVVRHEASKLPPPPSPSRQDVSGAPTFTPFTVAPSILNRAEVIQAMESEYPKPLRDAGLGGTVRVYFFIDEEGTVGKSVIDRSSGHEALDAAAMRVAAVFRFSPALNRNEKVPVWVSFPITFQVR